MAYTLKQQSYGLIFCMILILMTSCWDSSPQKTEKLSIPEVSVIQLKTTTLDITNTLHGRLEPIRKAEIRARIPGVIKKIFFEEGTYVQHGTLLYLMDDAAGRAQMTQAKARYVQAAANFNKISPLLQSGAISKKDYDDALTSMQAAKAELETSKINLDYAHIRAPISGRIGRSYETEGALVGQNQPTLLAVIQQENPLKINLNLSVSDFAKLKNYAKKTQTKIENLPFQVILNDGTIYPEEGKILFTDTTVDESSGQITLKGEVPNPDGILLPGLYVKIKLKVGSISNVFAIPINAIHPNESGATVTVVNTDHNYTTRQINIINEDNNYIYTNEGLKEGELVLVDGQMQLIMKPPKVSYKIINSTEEKNYTSTSNQ